MLSPLRWLGPLAIAGTLALGSAAPAAPREYKVFHTEKPPTVDGDLRDDIWRAVPWSGDFTGLQGRKSDVETQFALAWDEKFLYVALRCTEPHMDALQAGVAGRDPRIVNDDHIEIMLASADKPTVFFQIFVNSGRGRMDQWLDEGKEAVNFDAQRGLLEKAGLDTAARAAAQEWTVEMAIPLPKVKYPLKEGISYVGNICRVRQAGAIREMAWNPVHGDLHKSADFGLFKLVGEAPKPRPLNVTDAVALRNGDELKGRIVGFADGKVQFTSPALAEPVGFNASEVQRMDLAWTDSDAAAARFVLNNGAEISGTIAALSADAVGIESAALGRISVPRDSIARIVLGAAVMESHFDTGVLKPWESIAGTANFAEGAVNLAGDPRGGQFMSVLSLPLHQDRTVTFIAEYEAPAQFAPIRVQLFADRAHPQMQVQTAVTLVLTIIPQIAVLKDGQMVAQPARGQRMPMPKGPSQIKFSYNPTDGLAQAWFNGKLVSQVTAPDGPKQGEFVVFSSMRPMSVKRLAVYSGFPAPNDPTAGPKPGEVLAYLSNGDIVRANDLAFAGGKFVFTTEFGKLTLQPDRVVGIDLGGKAAKPAVEPGLTWVETASSRFPMQVLEITDLAVIGKSREFGDVKVLRKLVKSIIFPPAPAP